MHVTSKIQPLRRVYQNHIFWRFHGEIAHGVIMHHASSNVMNREHAKAKINMHELTKCTKIKNRE